MRVTNLVTGSVSQAGEQRGELATDCGIDVLPEDNFLESGSAGDLSRIPLAMYTFSFVHNPNLTRVWLLINRLAVVSTYGECQLSDRNISRIGEVFTGWKIINSAIPAEPRRVTGSQGQ